MPTDSSFAGELAQIEVGAGIRGGRPRTRARAQFYGLRRERPGVPRRRGVRAWARTCPFQITPRLVRRNGPSRLLNVEVDQQTISPSAFPYQYQEVRPFFSQAGQAFNHTAVSCIQCPQLLYTPAIPTFHTGYAIEGTQGLLSFSAFDAVGNGRLDKALALDFGVPTPTVHTR